MLTLYVAGCPGTSYHTFWTQRKGPRLQPLTNISVGKNNQYWFSSCRSFVPSFQGRLWSPHRRFGYQTQWKYNAGGQWRQDMDVWGFRIPWDYVLKKTTKIPNPIFTFFMGFPSNIFNIFKWKLGAEYVLGTFSTSTKATTYVIMSHHRLRCLCHWWGCVWHLWIWSQHVSTDSTTALLRFTWSGEADWNRTSLTPHGVACGVAIAWPGKRWNGAMKLKGSENSEKTSLKMS